CTHTHTHTRAHKHTHTHESVYCKVSSLFVFGVHLRLLLFGLEPLSRALSLTTALPSTLRTLYPLTHIFTFPSSTVIKILIQQHVTMTCATNRDPLSHKIQPAIGQHTHTHTHTLKKSHTHTHTHT